MVKWVGLVFVVGIPGAVAQKDGGTDAHELRNVAPASRSKGATAMSPKEECEQVMSQLLPLAQQMLAKHGEFYPVGAAMRPDGVVALVGVGEREEHPPSQKVIDSLLEVVRLGARDKKYRATGLAYDVRTVPPGTTEKTDAIAVRLDHVSGYSVVVMFPYKISPSHEVSLAPPFASQGPEDIFR